MPKEGGDFFFCGYFDFKSSICIFFLNKIFFYIDMNFYFYFIILSSDLLFKCDYQYLVEFESNYDHQYVTELDLYVFYLMHHLLKFLMNLIQCFYGM